jgi:transcriptional regulator with GAF, ATPase, and Fis domain
MHGAPVHRFLGEYRKFGESHRFFVVRDCVFRENGAMHNDALQQVLMTASRERSERTVLRIIVDGLAEQPQVALARIWLLRPGDICATCRMRPECPDQSRCLHLEASSGRSLAEPGADWARIDGDFRRFPVGARKVGQIAATGAPLFVANTAEQSEWIVRPEWAAREHIRNFAGQPLVFGSETLGVIALFSRVELSEIDFRWLRLFADQAAITIVNARAFEEIEQLKRRLELENEYLREEISQSQAFGDIVGSSPALNKVLEQIDLVATTNANVLILGESGTGKELVARAIHQRSQRRGRPLVKVNCASIPKELFESEFFGHAKGAFTGALRDRIGRFQLADGGTIFLDEVGEIPLDLQSKLLRVLQEREFERVGEETSRRVDVRIIAATNRDLEAESRAGRFREDLYYRLGVFPIQVPPLRDRAADIGPLAAHFARHFCEQLSLPSRKLTRGEIEALERYDWPGNIRELQNVIERALIRSRGGRLEFDLGRARRLPQRPTASRAEDDEPVLTITEIKELERANIERALRRCNGQVYGKEGAAALLGMRPTTLWSRLRGLGISTEK